MVFMTITGLFGTLFGIGIISFNIPIEAPSDSSLFVSIFSAAAAGSIQAMGVMLVFKSFQFGSMEVMYLFMNMRVLVQIVEEFLLFQILPSMVSSIGMAVALAGASIMMIFDQKKYAASNQQQKSD